MCLRSHFVCVCFIKMFSVFQRKLKFVLIGIVTDLRDLYDYYQKPRFIDFFSSFF